MGCNIRDRLAVRGRGFALMRSWQHNWRALSRARSVLNPAGDCFLSASIPSSAGEAISKYLDTLPDSRRTWVRGLLTALAYARGAGAEDAVWIRFAAALGYGATVADLDELRDSTVADYLLQAGSDHDGEPVTRLFHQALAEIGRASCRERV